MIREGRVLDVVRRCGVDVSRALETHRLAVAPRKDLNDSMEVCRARTNATLVTMAGSTSPGRFGDFMTCKIGKDAMNDVGLKQDHGVVVDSNGIITQVH